MSEYFCSTCDDTGEVAEFDGISLDYYMCDCRRRGNPNIGKNKNLYPGPMPTTTSNMAKGDNGIWDVNFYDPNTEYGSGIMAGKHFTDARK
jgi:hypothetical protein